jgi:bisphosphoglycerate-independent phosphoglycerate mutase (AlkP superfamily)
MATPAYDVPAAGATNSNRVVLVSIDGWGISGEKKGNAIANAVTDNMTKLEKEVRGGRITDGDASDAVT